jgi:catechol 2,3-dioxygenase-like lactoylglutathione lyase family enzyme
MADTARPVRRAKAPIERPSFIAIEYLKKYLDLKLGLEITKDKSTPFFKKETPMPAHLEHVNYTVSDPAATAAWMEKIFGWHIRWQGAAISGGYTIHVGTENHYVALYDPGTPVKPPQSNYTTISGLNHIAVVVDDLDGIEEIIKGHGFVTCSHANYEPGRRFYFHDQDGIEYEVVQYG